MVEQIRARKIGPTKRSAKAFSFRGPNLGCVERPLVPNRLFSNKRHAKIERPAGASSNRDPTRTSGADCPRWRFRAMPAHTSSFGRGPGDLQPCTSLLRLFHRIEKGTTKRSGREEHCSNVCTKSPSPCNVVCGGKILQRWSRPAGPPASPSFFMLTFCAKKRGFAALLRRPLLSKLGAAHLVRALRAPTLGFFARPSSRIGVA